MVAIRLAVPIEYPFPGCPAAFGRVGEFGKNVFFGKIAGRILAKQHVETVVYPLRVDRPFEDRVDVFIENDRFRFFQPAAAYIQVIDDVVHGYDGK
ncbi:hypothetical protein D3C87_1754870 [compost metagenome]